MYKHIKKEHLFVFLALFTALVLFAYFEDFNYTGLVVKESCTGKGYQCCNEGEGVNYFSLDDSCRNNQQCWASCSEQLKESNLITSSAVLDNIWNHIRNFFVKLFSKEAVGGVGTSQCQGKNILFKISGEQGGSHASITNDYQVPVCADDFKEDENGVPILYLSSETNAHVEKSGLTSQNYNIQIKIKTEGNQDPTCQYKAACTNNGEECLFSISGDTNAHVGACTGNEFPIYNKKLCCEIPAVPQGSGRAPRELPQSGGFTLNLNINSQEGSVIISPESERYEQGSIITLTATANNGYEFSHFKEGDMIRGLNPLSITMNENKEITVIFERRSGGTTEIPQLTSSDYETYWANDGRIAFSFDKYIKRLTQQQLSNIQKFRIYRKQPNQEFTLITTLEKSSTPGKLIKDYRGNGNTPSSEAYEDDKYDFWDDYPGGLLTNGVAYSYKIVPVNLQEVEIAPDQQAIIQITPQATNTQLTISGSCNEIIYASCSEEPGYCGIGGNLIKNNGFDSILSSWERYDGRYEIIEVQNHRQENSNVLHINIGSPVQDDLYTFYQTIDNIKPNTYYRLSGYIKADSIDASNKPFLHVECYTSLSDGKTRKFLASPVIPLNNDKISNAGWTDYNYIFRTYNGANKCNIHPVYFQEPDSSRNRPGAKGEVWIDGLRLEELSSTSNTPAISNDCGICGCSSGYSCSPDNACTLTPVIPAEEDCESKLGDADSDGINALFDSDCSATFNNRSEERRVGKEGRSRWSPYH